MDDEGTGSTFEAGEEEGCSGVGPLLIAECVR